MTTVNSATWRMLSQPPVFEPSPQGLDALLLRAGGWVNRLKGRQERWLHRADKIVAMQADYARLADRRLKALIGDLHQRFRLGRQTHPDGDQALAIVAEVAARTVGLRPNREQIAGAIAINAGCIVEMATGEGKTLMAVLPAVLAGWRGRGCHLITANEYLVTRDAAAMRDLYRCCGLQVDFITQEMTAAQRKSAYGADVTYCTHKEVAADFLRDRLLMGRLHGLPAALLSKVADGRGDILDRIVQRGLECAIVDEADSVFIDEAVTPLLISGERPNRDHRDAYVQASRLAIALDPSSDYRIDRQYGDIHLLPEGKRHLAELARPLGGLWSASRRREELIIQHLVAREFYLRDKQYVVDQGKVVIIDEFTGRSMPDRTWREGLHQAIEAKEGLEITPPKETFARISFQRFFRLYRNLAGMTGTVTEAQAELWAIYRLPVVRVPTHRSCRRIVLPERVFTTADAKWQAVVSQIRKVQRTGRPVLIGTRSVRESEALSRHLTARRVTHRLLNAVNQSAEAQIIAAAGSKGRITVSTNMAGRGTDIKLGPGVAEQGGLHVIATSRSDARRIDRQLMGRCARQGDPGSVQSFISLEDGLFQRNARPIGFALKKMYANKSLEISSFFWRCLIDRLQYRAERVSRHLRKDILAADNWIDSHLGFTANDL